MSSENIENELIIDLHNYKENGSVFFRKAARAIIKNGNTFLCIHSKYGDYKFPGGGVKKGETLEQALIREVQEETGYIVKQDKIIQEYITHERRKGDPDDLMIMDSYYFSCEIDEKRCERNLDDYEKEYDYKVAWLPLEKIISENEKCNDLINTPWVLRENMVFKKLLLREKNNCR